MNIYGILSRDKNDYITLKAIEGKNKIELIENNFIKSIEVKEGFLIKCFYGIVLVLRHIKITLTNKIRSK
tara:strand:+ start:601 stop:810 length:210 start_codon:yes stop_codon:yes gene_type:complete